jgi:PEP-CTERM motif
MPAFASTTPARQRVAAFAAALLCSPLLASAAALTTVAPGGTLTVTDPAGTGRTAEITFVSGTGAFALSNGGLDDGGYLPNGAKAAAVGGLIAAMNTGRVTLSPLDGATVTEKVVTLANGRKQRAVANIDARVSNITLDTQTGDVITANAVGGAIESAPYVESTLDGGSVHFSNLSFDLPNKMVYADIGYSPLLLDGSNAPLITRPRVAMWTVDSITGPTRISPSAVLAAADGDFSPLQAEGITVTQSPDDAGLYLAQGITVFHDLRVTPEGFGYVAMGLGLAPGSIGYDALDGVNVKAGGWGTITSRLNFAMAVVPEPATYALMGLGLVGVALASRRGAMARPMR